MWCRLHLMKLIYGTPPADLVPAWWRHHMKTFYALLAICAGIHWSPGIQKVLWSFRKGQFYTKVYCLRLYILASAIVCRKSRRIKLTLLRYTLLCFVSVDWFIFHGWVPTHKQLTQCHMKPSKCIIWERGSCWFCTNSRKGLCPALQNNYVLMFHDTSICRAACSLYSKVVFCLTYQPFVVLWNHSTISCFRLRHCLDPRRWWQCCWRP